MKPLNIDVHEGFTTEIAAIDFYNYKDGYFANVGIRCGDSGIVLLCLSGDSNESRAVWETSVMWSDEDEAFQVYVESEFTALEFFKWLERDNGLQNNPKYLSEMSRNLNSGEYHADS